MNTPETNTANIAEIDQLAEIFTAACEQAVAETETETQKAPVLTAALVLTAPTISNGWA